MSYFDDEIDDLMEVLCDCENYHRCTWHQRLKEGEDRRTVESDMKQEVYRRDIQWDRENGAVAPVEE
jgi:hypothetical protein